jgi:four helix bundle protein
MWSVAYLIYTPSEITTERILTVNKRELENRTKRFALRIIAFVASLPKGRIGDVVGYQLLKAGTSVGANYREANRAESRNDFIHKIAIVEKESSESHYWLELVHESNLGEVDERKWLLNEAGQLLAIFTQIGKSTKLNRRH